MQKKTCFLTGATSGIGKEVLKILVSRGHQVFYTSRTAEKGKILQDEMIKNLPDAKIHCLVGDLSKTNDVKRIAGELTKQTNHLDILINNAACYTHQKSITPDGFEEQLFVNYLVPRFFCEHFLPLLDKAKNGRVVNVTSRMHLRASTNLDDINYKEKKYAGYSAYSQTKLLITAYTNYFANEHAKKGITAVSMHPGVYSTGITRNLPQFIRFLWNTFIPGPEKGAEHLAYIALENQENGVFFNKNKINKPHAIAQDPNFWKKILAIKME